MCLNELHHGFDSFLSIGQPYMTCVSAVPPPSSVMKQLCSVSFY